MSRKSTKTIQEVVARSICPMRANRWPGILRNTERLSRSKASKSCPAEEALPDKEAMYADLVYRAVKSALEYLVSLYLRRQIWKRSAGKYSTVNPP